MQFVCKDNDFFRKTSLDCSMRGFLILLFTIIMSAAVFAAPARRGKLLLHQPDGSCFNAYFVGDENARIKLTENGESIVQDESGWWCYAVYDQRGIKSSSGYPVGKEVPAGVLSASRNIPYDLIVFNAAKKRRTAELNRLERTAKCLRMRASADVKTEKAGLVILAQFGKGLEVPMLSLNLLPCLLKKATLLMAQPDLQKNISTNSSMASTTSRLMSQMSLPSARSALIMVEMTRMAMIPDLIS